MYKEASLHMRGLRLFDLSEPLDREKNPFQSKGVLAGFLFISRYTKEKKAVTSNSVHVQGHTSLHILRVGFMFAASMEKRKKKKKR